MQRVPSFVVNRSAKWLIVVLACVVFSVPAMAQFEANEVDENAKRYGATRAKNYARRPTGVDTDRAAFGRYIRDYTLPLMTQFDPESLAELGKRRYDFMRNYLWAAEESVQKDLTKLVLTEMSKVVRGRYHPAVRYNAMLMIGQLDSKYASTGSSGSVPLPEANEYLVRYVTAGVDTPKAPAPLIVGALVGLERHAKSLGSLPPANGKATANALLKVLEKDSLPHDVPPSVAQWLKVIAARGLASVGALGDGNRVHNAMMKTIGDESARLNTRVRVAELLENYKTAYTSASGVDEKAAVQTLMQLATDIAADEEERADEYENQMIEESGGIGAVGGFRGGGASIAMGGFGGYGTGDIELPDEYQVRRLIMRLNGLTKGIEAVKPAIKDQRLSGLLNEVTQAVSPVLSRAKQKDVILLNLAGDVKKMANVVTTATAAVGVEAVEAPPENEEEAIEQMLEEEAAAEEEAEA